MSLYFKALKAFGEAPSAGGVFVSCASSGARSAAISRTRRVTECFGALFIVIGVITTSTEPYSPERAHGTHGPALAARHRNVRALGRAMRRPLRTSGARPRRSRITRVIAAPGRPRRYGPFHGVRPRRLPHAPWAVPDGSAGRGVDHPNMAVRARGHRYRMRRNGWRPQSKRRGSPDPRS